MKSILKMSLASALVVSSVAATAPQAFANGHRHHFHDDNICMNGEDVLPILFVGAALGAVTGGVGAAVAWGSAYAVGGAAVGGGAGLLLSSAHAHHNCNY